MTQGVLLLAHGARNPAWAEPFQQLAASLQVQRPAMPVQLAFLEFLEPDFPAACGRLAAAGCRKVTVIPCFFGGAGHVLRDLPSLLEQVRIGHPLLELDVQAALGDQPALKAALVAVCLGLLEEPRP